MPLAGIALAPLLVSPLAPPSPRGSVAFGAAEAARRPRALRRVRCSAAAASGGGGDAGELSRATLLWRAAKLPIYSVALVPLTVSSLRLQIPPSPLPMCLVVAAVSESFCNSAVDVLPANQNDQSYGENKPNWEIAHHLALCNNQHLTRLHLRLLAGRDCCCL